MAAQAAFLACGLITLGLIFMVIGAVGARPAQNSLRWPAVEGKITATQTIFDPLSGRQQIHLKYEYTVQEKDFTGSRISFRSAIPFMGSTSETIREEATRYPPGKPVQVYYDPTDPTRCVLEPGNGLAQVIPIGVGGLFFILGLVSGIFAFL